MGPALPTIGAGQRVELAVRAPGVGAGPAGARRRPAPVGGESNRCARIPQPRPGARPGLMADDQFLDSQRYGFETRAIRAGQPHDPTTGAVVTPISMATTFAQEAVGRHRGYEYGRTGNPTRRALEECLASLEGADHGLAFASGMSATDTILRRLRPGDHLVLGDDAYGGTFRLISKVIAPMGIEWTAVDLTDLASLEAAVRPTTRIVWIETPTNPLLTVFDIEAISRIVRTVRSAAGRGQHLRHAVPPTAPASRRPRGGPQHHQVHRWPQRCGRRFRGGR